MPVKWNAVMQKGPSDPNQGSRLVYGFAAKTESRKALKYRTTTKQPATAGGGTTFRCNSNRPLHQHPKQAKTSQGSKCIESGMGRVRQRRKCRPCKSETKQMRAFAQRRPADEKIVKRSAAAQTFRMKCLYALRRTKCSSRLSTPVGLESGRMKTDSAGFVRGPSFFISSAFCIRCQNK